MAGRFVARVRLWVAAAVVCAGVSVPAAGQGPVLVDRVLAVVSGTIVTLSDVRTAIALGFVDTTETADPVAAALPQLIERRLVLDEAVRYGAQEPDLASVEALAASARRRFATQYDWDEARRLLGIDEGIVRTLANDVLVAEQFLADRFDTLPAPTETDLRDAYARWGHELTGPDGRLAFDDARSRVETRLRGERRRQAAREWVGRLRRRADVSELYTPSR